MTKAKPLPPAELLRERFYYDPETGLLTWRTPKCRRIRQGDAAGSTMANGYKAVAIKIDKMESFLCHRIIWCFVTGNDPEDLEIDHIDGDRGNNRFANLRIATRTNNSYNTRKPITNSSGYKGVYWHKKAQKWCAIIGHDGNKSYLGLFDTPELAHMAYCKAAAELHGDFARAA